MILVNNVRNLVMFVLNKNNNGYIAPDQFDSFCQMAQLEIFENLFYQYNNWLNKENRRLTNTSYADLPKNIREQIDIFATYSTPSNFAYDSGTNLWSYTGNDLYRAGNLSLVAANGKKTDIEEVSKGNINKHINSPLISPSIVYPIYDRIGESFRVYPTIPSGYSVELFYIRTPKNPKWTFINVQGNPVYNASASDLQNIELHISNFVPLVTKVLFYCGVNLREPEVEQIANSEEMKTAQKQS